MPHPIIIDDFMQHVSDVDRDHLAFDKACGKRHRLFEINWKMAVLEWHSSAPSTITQISVQSPNLKAISSGLPLIIKLLCKSRRVVTSSLKAFVRTRDAIKPHHACLTPKYAWLPLPRRLHFSSDACGGEMSSAESKAAPWAYLNHFSRTSYLIIEMFLRHYLDTGNVFHSFISLQSLYWLLTA